MPADAVRRVGARRRNLRLHERRSRGGRWRDAIRLPYCPRLDRLRLLLARHLDFTTHAARRSWIPDRTVATTRRGITNRWSGPRRRYTSLAAERRACGAVAPQLRSLILPQPL